MSAVTFEGRDREADLTVIANYIQAHLFTWCMPADWGADFGYFREDKHASDHGWNRTYSGSSEVLQMLGIKRTVGLDDPSYDADDLEYTKEAVAYAKSIWMEAGDMLRSRIQFAPAHRLPTPPVPGELPDIRQMRHMVREYDALCNAVSDLLSWLLPRYSGANDYDGKSPVDLCEMACDELADAMRASRMPDTEKQREDNVPERLRILFAAWQRDRKE